MNFKKILAALVVSLVFIFTSLTVAAQQPEGKAPKGKGTKQEKVAQGELAPAGKLNINTATEEQFDSLPKIGPKVAKRIVEYRESHKSFKNVDELRNVKGIGPKVLELIRPHITV